MRKAVVITLVVVAGCAFGAPTWVEFVEGYDEGTPPQVNVVASDTDHTVVEVTTPGMWVEEVTVGELTFQRLTVPEAGTTFETGCAEMPAVGMVVAVPGMKGIAWEVIDADTREYEDYNVYPRQVPTTDDVDDSGEFAYDETFYGMDMEYPAGDGYAGPAGIWRDLRVVHPTLFPVRFNPYEQKLTVAYYLKYELTYAGEGIENTKPDPTYAIQKKDADAYRELIINYDELGLAETPWQLDGVDYLIIHDPALGASAARLAGWASKRGYAVDMKSTDYTGHSAREIKTHITYQYNNGLLDYVVLMGDVANVPMGCVAIDMEADDRRDYPSDYWYSLVSGTDLYPEFPVARLSALDNNLMNNELNKIFAYNGGVEPGDWAENVLMVAHREYREEEGVKKYKFIPFKYDLCSMENETPYYTPDFIMCFGTDYWPNPGFCIPGSDNTDVRDWINSGIGIVNYRGHGDYYNWHHWCAESPTGDWSWLNIHELDNGQKYPVVFNICCWNAQLEKKICEETPETQVEAWLSSDDAAVAALGATRISFTDKNNVFDRALFQEIFYHGNTVLGSVVRNALMAFFAAMNPDEPEVIAMLYMYVVMGEPTTDIRTGALAGLNVSHIASHATGTFEVVVTVKESDGVTAVPDAVVCLYKEGYVHNAYVTDANGEVSFEVTADTAGEITVTARKHAYIPYEGTITITE